MFTQELRRPWSIAVMVGILLALGLLLHDRVRTPLYQWPENPDGIPANEFQLFAHKREPVEHSPDPMLQAVEALKPDRSYTFDLPGIAICDEDDCNSPLRIDEAQAKAVRSYCRLQREALREIHKRAKHISFGDVKPSERLVLNFRHGTVGSRQRLHFALYQEMLLHTFDHDIDGALRSIESMFKLAQSFAAYADADGQYLRLTNLTQTYNAIRVLIHRVSLQPEHWKRLIELTVEASSGLDENIRLAFEYEATELLNHYGYPRMNTFRILYGEEVYREFGLSIPLNAGEIVAQSIFSLAGFEHSDKASLVRLTLSHRDSFKAQGGFGAELSKHSPFVHPGSFEMKNRFLPMVYTLPTCVAFPELLRVAALLDEHRQRHGTFPETLEAVGGEVIQDPYRASPLGYLATERGVKIYSVGRNGVDDTDPNVVRAERGERKDDHSLELRH